MPTADEAIGRIETSEGSVFAIRADGTSVQLSIGDPVFQGDVLRTSENANVGVTFVDNSTFTLDENGELTLDEMVYDPDAETGSFSSSLTSGVFSFVSGQIAKANPDAMEISTPVATIGIRGTQGVIKQESDGPMRAALMQEPDGSTGELILTNSVGTIVLNQPNQLSEITSINAIPQQPVTINQLQLVGAFGGKAIQILNTTRRAAKKREAEAKQQEALVEEQAALEAEAQTEEAKLAADEAAAVAEEAALAAQAAEGAEAEALLAEAEALAQAAAEAEAAFLEAQAEAELLALNAENALEAATLAAEEAALVAEIEAAFEEQITQIEQEINDLVSKGINPVGNIFGPGPGDIGPGNQYQGDPIGNDIFVGPDQFADFLDETLFFEATGPADGPIFLPEGQFLSPEEVAPFVPKSNTVVVNDPFVSDRIDDRNSEKTYVSLDNEPIDFHAADDPFTDTFQGGFMWQDYIYLDGYTTSNITLNLNDTGLGTINYSNGHHDKFLSIELFQLGKYHNTVNINTSQAANQVELHGHTSASVNTLALKYSTTLNLSDIKASKFKTLDLSGQNADLSGQNANVDVTISDAAAAAFTGGNQDMYIEGDAGDAVNLSYDFVLSSTADATYNIYSAIGSAYSYNIRINKAITNVTGFQDKICGCNDRWPNIYDTGR